MVGYVTAPGPLLVPPVLGCGDTLKRHRLVPSGAVAARAAGVAGNGGRGEEEGGDEVEEADGGGGEGTAGFACADGAQDGEDRPPRCCGESGVC